MEKHTSKMQTITNLFQHKSQVLEMKLKNLQINEVETNASYIKTLDIIKNQTLLNPVIFSEHRLHRHDCEKRDMPASYSNPFGGPIDIYTFIFIYSFTGNNELFEYIPTNVAITAGRIQLPAGKNVTVNIELGIMDINLAESELARKMEPTFSLIKANNTQIQNWNKNFESIIEQKLLIKKQELFAIYRNL